MKNSKKLILGIIAVLVIVICLTGLYWKNKVNQANEVNTGNWEAEFYHCADIMEERLENMDAEPYPSTWSDEAERLEKRRIRAEAWAAYMNFVEAWLEQEGDTQEAKEEIYKNATILIVLLDDNYDSVHGAYGFAEDDREPYEFVYCQGDSREKMLAEGNKALQKENIIDTNIAQLNEEFADMYTVDKWTCFLEASSWQDEFEHCAAMLEELFFVQLEDTEKSVMSKETLKLWEILIEQWFECNKEYIQIGAGTGLGIETHRRKRECYRTATLLMIAYYEQFLGEYEFVYDKEAAREVMVEAAK